MQHFPDIPPETTLTGSRQLILDRDRSLLSCFAGDEFPSVELSEGMLCYRSDLGQLYQLKSLDGPSWVIIADLNQSITSQEKVDTIEQQLTDNINSSNNATNQSIFDLEDKTFNEFDGHQEQIKDNNTQIANLDQRCDTIVNDAQNLEQEIKDYIDNEVSNITLPTALMSIYTGEIIPAGWLECNGQAVSRTSYANLFGVLNTAFGDGDGETTFNLPDLRGRVPMGIGQGDGLSNRSLNQKVGNEKHILTVAQMPKHNHKMESGPYKIGTEQYSRVLSSHH